MKFRPALSLVFMASFTNAFSEIPVRRVTLFKHGVGFFERSGELKAGETARLDFKADEMNDVLKSLIVAETNGARVSGLRYDSSDPLDRRLAEFPFTLEGVPSLSAFLTQLKGENIEVVLGNETVRGAIVTARLVPSAEKGPERELLVLMTDAGDLRTIDLMTASSVRFPDPALQARFRDYLQTVASGRSREKRSVYVDSLSDRARNVAVSYMLPSPVWKSSYRLLLREGSGNAAASTSIEGWAIVDNTTSDDWDNITLSLVSGRPISFISRLYEPKYITRPGAELPEERAQGPVLHEGAVQQEAAARGGVIGGMIGAVPSAAPPPPPRASERPRMSKDSAAEMMMVETARDEAFMKASSSIEAMATGGNVGELFEYRFSQPVVVKKGQSAMIPFLQGQIDARKLLIYTSANPNHPMNAAEIVNNTGKTLDGGPITVFDAESYAGEGLIETLRAGDKRLISYAVDLGTRVGTIYGSESAVVREIKANRGILTIRQAAREIRSYNVKNVDSKAKRLLIEHPVRPQYKLVDVKPVETTANMHRFEVKLAPNSEVKFPVTEEREFDNTVALANVTPEGIISYSQNKTISAEGRKQLEQAAQFKRQIADSEREMRELDEQINALFRDQERLRQNIQGLNSVSGQQEQVRKYAQALASQEAQLADLRDRRTQAEQARTKGQAALNTLLESLSF